MNRIYFGDNLPILKSLPSESIDLIYIDPPFNTGKKQTRKKIKTVRSESGDRKGFKGNTYKTTDLGTKAYQDSFNNYVDGILDSEIEKSYKIIAPEGSINYIENFLKPRLEEAYRVLKSHGSLYFHIDYREVHYCKLLLDRIFGRDSFINEIIWAYDYGGRAKSRWPAKHDNILFYVKDPTKFIFDTSKIDRERYMAPGLVGKKKADLGKLPTDTWWYPYVPGGQKLTDTWWQSIVGTNSKERSGYPTQKPRKVIDRIIKASTFPGNTVLDFFAGSGTVGDSCIELNRNFILIDNNPESLEVMAYRFVGVEDIEWINFDPETYQKKLSNTEKKRIQETRISSSEEDKHNYSADFQMLVASANYLQAKLEEQSDLWKDSPLEWVLELSSARKGKLGRNLIASWCESKGLETNPPIDSNASLLINDHPVAIKFSTLWYNGNYKFQQIRNSGYELVICLGISPRKAHCWVFNREYAKKHATPQHKVAKGSDYWITINPENPPEWVKDYGGTLDQAYLSLNRLLKKSKQ
jgi:site-specific DNA-methyltransferase (adenine-specific)